MKKALCIAVIFSIFLNILCSCKDTKSFDDSLQEKTYSPVKSVVIGYPDFNSTTCRLLNTAIVEHVKEMLDISEYDESELYADIGYRITFCSSDIVSMVFEGLYNVKSAAHPVSFFDSLTVEVESGRLLSLHDYYEIDSEFGEWVRVEYKTQACDYFSKKLNIPMEDVSNIVESEFDDIDCSQLTTRLNMADSKNSDIHSFLTEDSVGISLPVSHALGDHCEIYLDR